MGFVVDPLPPLLPELPELLLVLLLELLLLELLLLELLLPLLLLLPLPMLTMLGPPLLPAAGPSWARLWDDLLNKTAEAPLWAISLETPDAFWLPDDDWGSSSSDLPLAEDMPAVVPGGTKAGVIEEALEDAGDEADVVVDDVVEARACCCCCCWAAAAAA